LTPTASRRHSRIRRLALGQYAGSRVDGTKGAAMYRKIMIVVDDDDVADVAAAEGLDLAATHGAEVLCFHVLHSSVVPISVGDMLPTDGSVWEQQRAEADRCASRVLSHALGMAAQRHVIAHAAVGSGTDPAACIAQAARDRQCDLIVVGAHGRNALQRWIHGSLAVSLLPLAGVPLLVCKPPSVPMPARM
jgi:nucleotide-binding universal stress UspA family protein